ncbi:MAG: hypothetical protein PHO41_03740 [Eubacteriales bacterium]|nr:hypothetical protein [Eubacteriales bacterium]
MDKNRLLSDYGIDYDKGLKNCMGDPSFYKKILSMFVQDTCFAHAGTAHTNKAYKELFGCMHELKGVSGNAALMGLYEATVPLVELLRNGTELDAEVDRMFARVEEAYQLTCRGIEQIMAE